MRQTLWKALGITTALALLPVSVAPVHAEKSPIYHYIDKNGVMCFTNISSPVTTLKADRRASNSRKPGENHFQDAIKMYGEQYGVDSKLIAAIVRCESNFDPMAVSPKGAQGLMQLMPDTARMVNVDDPFDPLQKPAHDFWRHAPGPGRLQCRGWRRAQVQRHSPVHRDP